MYVDGLVLDELRAIQRSSISFVHPASPEADRRELPNVNLLVGSNGAGKTTVLRGVAAAALGRFVDLDEMTDRSIRDWPRFGSTEPCSARATLRLFPPRPAGAADRGIEVEATIRVPRDGSISRADSDGSLTDADEVVLFAYGSQRAIGRRRRSLAEPRRAPSRADAVRSLFSDDAALMSSGQLLAGTDDASTRQRLIDTVNTLMPPDIVVRADVDDTGGLLVNSQGLDVPWTVLSDGAQSYMAWLFDLVYRLNELASDGDVRAVRGTVLIDEIDQRMHPRWQQVLLEQLSVALPQLQFICSAHSPLVAGGLRAENLTLLEPDPDAPGAGAMRATRLSEDLYGRTADGVLSSSYFNLPSSRSAHFRNELDQLADAARDHDDAALEFIRTLAAGSAGSQPRPRSPIADRPDRFRTRRP